MAKNFLSNVYEGGLTVDPTAGAGVAAAIGSILPRRGSTELWQKFGAGNTDWVLIFNGAAVPAGDGVSFFGTGFDGNMVFDGVANALGGAGLSLAPAAGVYTLTRCIFANSISVSGGVTIAANGFRIFCLNTLTNAGLIHANGGNGANADAVNGGAGGIAITPKVLPGGSTGAVGSAATGGGSQGISPGALAQLGAAVGVGAAGSNGGVLQGGGGGANSVGTAGGGVNAHAAFSANSSPSYNSIAQALTGRDVSGANIIQNGTSGGSGRPGAGAGQGGSGGGGASAATLLVAARFIAGAGSLEARGGNGGAAGAGAGGSAGGSGGGSGGTLVLITQSRLPVTNTLSVAGGAGSAAGGAGASTAGGTGGTGIIYRFSV